MKSLGTIAIIDDEEELRSMLRDYLSTKGFHTVTFTSGTEFRDSIENEENRIESFDLVITDFSMPGIDGLEVTQFIKERAPLVPVVLITAFASIDSAIKATKNGTYDYLAKPFKLGHIDSVVSRALHLKKIEEDNFNLRSSLETVSKKYGIIGKTKVMLDLFKTIEHVGPAQSSVLIQGESGTGKELVAKAIHEASHRSDKPFVAINCSAIPEHLLESELFGHLKGSFTGAIGDKIGLFEQANSGTIFLDEIGDMPIHLQAKILRSLQERKIRPVGSNKEKEVDVRVIAATHRNLTKMIREDLFREDLYFRLSVIPINLMPLRKRKDDIPTLVNHFLRKYSARNQSTLRRISPEAMEMLIEASWVGNVRELENYIERLTVMCENFVLNRSDLIDLKLQDIDKLANDSLVHDWPTVEELERRYIELVVQKTGGAKERAAQILGVNRRTLYRKLSEEETKVTI